MVLCYCFFIHIFLFLLWLLLTILLLFWLLLLFTVQFIVTIFAVVDAIIEWAVNTEDWRGFHNRHRDNTIENGLHAMRASELANSYMYNVHVKWMSYIVGLQFRTKKSVIFQRWKRMVWFYKTLVKHKSSAFMVLYYCCCWYLNWKPNQCETVFYFFENFSEKNPFGNMESVFGFVIIDDH